MARGAAKGRGCFRRGCGCSAVVVGLLAVGLAFLFWRTTGEPEAFQEQRRQLEQRTPEEREALATTARQRLEGLFSSPRGDSPSTAPPLPGSAQPRPLPEDPAIASPGSLAPRSRDPGAGDAADRSRSSGPPGEPSAPEDDSPEEPGTRRISFQIEELNALLQQEAARWMAQRGGDGELPLSNPTVAIEGDHLVLFVQLSTPAASMLLGIPFDVTMDASGGVVHVLGVRLGQLPLPGLEALPRLLRGAGDPRLDELADEAEQAAAGYPIEPYLELEDGRTLRILDAEVDPVEQAVHLLVQGG